MVKILFIPGFGCTSVHLGSLPEVLTNIFGARVNVSVFDPTTVDRSTTAAYLVGLKAQHTADQDQILVGHSFGGHIANLLLLQGFAKRAILISPSLPSDWFPINLDRLSVFGKHLISNAPFQFTDGQAQQYLFENIPVEKANALTSQMHTEPASLIREYAWRGKDTWLHQAGFDFIRQTCTGAVITGASDVICRANQQRELSEKLGFRHWNLNAGHCPHLEYENGRLVQSITVNFVNDVLNGQRDSFTKAA